VATGPKQQADMKQNWKAAKPSEFATIKARITARYARLTTHHSTP
jgi:hypothetical protein